MSGWNVDRSLPSQTGSSRGLVISNVPIAIESIQEQSYDVRLVVERADEISQWVDTVRAIRLPDREFKTRPVRRNCKRGQAE